MTLDDLEGITHYRMECFKL